MRHEAGRVVQVQCCGRGRPTGHRGGAVSVTPPANGTRWQPRARDDSSGDAMATTAAGTYEERIAKFGVASLEEVAAAAAKPDAVFLDIRSRACSVPPVPAICLAPFACVVTVALCCECSG